MTRESSAFLERLMKAASGESPAPGAKARALSALSAQATLSNPALRAGTSGAKSVVSSIATWAAAAALLGGGAFVAYKASTKFPESPVTARRDVAAPLS